MVQKMTSSKLALLLAEARNPSPGKSHEEVENAVFKALLNATVYAHVPRSIPSKVMMRFVQFVRPDNGLPVLPFFSDKEQCDAAGGESVLSIAMSGRKLFELTYGATLMLNPNLDAVTLYPPEISALLQGRPLGSIVKHRIEEAMIQVAVPSFGTAALERLLRELFQQEGSVRSAFLAEVKSSQTDGVANLILTIILDEAYKERVLHLTALAIKHGEIDLDLPIDVRLLALDAALDNLCLCGLQIYGGSPL